MIYSSYRETLLRHFLLDLDPSIYVVPLYDNVGGGDLPQLRSLNHND